MKLALIGNDGGVRREYDLAGLKELLRYFISKGNDYDTAWNKSINKIKESTRNARF